MKSKNSLIEAFRRIFFQSSTLFHHLREKCALWPDFSNFEIKLSPPLLKF